MPLALARSAMNFSLRLWNTIDTRQPSGMCLTLRGAWEDSPSVQVKVKFDEWQLSSYLQRLRPFGSRAPLDPDGFPLDHHLSSVSPQGLPLEVGSLWARAPRARDPAGGDNFSL